MPIQKKWSKFTKKRLASVPELPGAYELGNEKGNIVGIGKGDSLKGIKSRLLWKKANRPKSVKKFRYKLTTPSQDPEKLEQKHGEKFERKHGKLPRLQKRLPRKH